jgi:hypothetical protein
MFYIKEDVEPADLIVKISMPFVRPWLAMLALGGLGHRLNLSILFIDYWTVFLGVVVIRLLFGNVPVSKFKAAASRKAIK